MGWLFRMIFGRLSITEKYLESATYRFIFASIAAIFIFVFRYYKVGRSTYMFLIWNLFLAWLPYILSYIFAFSIFWTHKKKHIHFLKCFLLTPLSGITLLLFLPNSFYIFTDLIHLIANGQSWYKNFQKPDSLIWFDLLFFLYYGLLGLFLGCHTLLVLDYIMWLKKVPRWWRIVCIWGMLFLSSYGIIIGRFARLNSWDIVFNTNILAEKLFYVIVDVQHNFEFSLLYTIFSGFAYLYMQTIFQPLRSIQKGP